MARTERAPHRHISQSHIRFLVALRASLRSAFGDWGSSRPELPVASAVPPRTPPPPAAIPSPGATPSPAPIRLHASTPSRARFATARPQGLDTMPRRRDDQVEGSPTRSWRNCSLRTGYSVTRYQGNTVRLQVKDKEMYLRGKAQVSRDSAVMLGDTITFNDSTQIVEARGDTVLLRDPSRGPDDVVGRQLLRYDVRNREGLGARRVHRRGERRAMDRPRRGRGVQGRHHRRRRVHVLRAQRELHELPGSDTAFPLRVVRDQDDLEEHHRRATGGDVHRRHPGALAAVHLPGRPQRAAQRHHPAAHRLLGHHPQLVRLPPDDRGLRLLLRDQRLPGRRVLDGLAQRRQAHRKAIRAGSSTTAGLVMRVKDRFMAGDLGISFQFLQDGSTNQQYSLAHRQEFSQRTKLSANINYVTNTTVQRNTTFNPYVAVQTISSQLNFSTGRGPFSLSPRRHAAAVPGPRGDRPHVPVAVRSRRSRSLPASGSRGRHRSR